MTEITMTNWRTMMMTAMKSAADKVGVDILTGLKTADCNVDRTWGDLVGIVFMHEDKALEERAARFAAKWISRNMQHLRTHTRQISSHYRGLEETHVGSRNIRTTGHVVSWCYWPCAD